MAELTPAEKAAKAAEDKRRAALTPEQRAEEDRRAAMTQEERDEEDLARMENEEAERNNARGRNVALPGDRAAITQRVVEAKAAARAKEATVEGTVARGREVYTEAGQEIPHREGDKIMLTPAEHAKLTSAGHLLTEDGNRITPAGPKVYSDANLILGNGVGQGKDAPSPSK